MAAIIWSSIAVTVNLIILKFVNCFKIYSLLLNYLKKKRDYFGRPNCVYVYVKLSYGEGNGTPLQYSCLENPMDGGAW